MDVPIEEQELFQNITRNVAASENELNEPKVLSIDCLKHVSCILTAL
jgi:Ase1/PRC1/MAP65 family protein